MMVSSLRWMLFLLSSIVCTAQYNLCPSSSIENVQDAFNTTDGTTNVQLGVTHRIPCPSFRSHERQDGVIWHKSSSLDDTSMTVRLISRSRGTVYPTSDRYMFSSESRLVIKHVNEADEGRYLCQVIPHFTTHREEDIYVNVIGNIFPAVSSDTSTTTTLKRGHRHRLACECALSNSPSSVVYWSTGEGISTVTKVIGARFSDGTQIQAEYGANYGIDSGSALVFNSLSDDGRFWCHTFFSDGTTANCYTDVQIKDESEIGFALQASRSSFYLLKNTRQVLPCTSWTSSQKTCEVSWMKDDGTSGSHLLSYTLWNNHVEFDGGFDLVNDFALSIESVNDDHTGTYRCSLGPGTKHDSIKVSVIGEMFPLYDGINAIHDTATYEQDVEIPCLALTNDNNRAKATLIWSHGAPEDKETEVIGIVNLPNGSTVVSRNNSCYNISQDRSLRLRNCRQDGNARYWCHVFSYDEMLTKSFVDIIMQKELIGSGYNTPTSSSDGPNATTLIIIVSIITGAGVFVH
ncbi:uncharacterized protein LOC110975386 [Acanthaster planci]|uniref:Uncharacterized protein LOC110975386 n=1 Tax=Acanthaster planci TaxID=133434 RepID=A0A8B7XU49_ACAPL|nr:uncharacterized protein LOC110975386 [Acanthaster planci]